LFFGEILYFCGVIKNVTIMAQVAGIKVERASTGVPKYVTIDLRKHSDVIPFLEKKGVEMDEPIKWTAKMKRSLEQAKNGEWEVGDINNFWNV
jgi:hypothetical protein